jgi:hypothetical protein
MPPIVRQPSQVHTIFATQDIWNGISEIVVRFSLLECDKCAIAIINWLDKTDIPYKVLKLKTQRPSDFYIISDRVGSNESITENGIHYGVEVLDKVFDNLSSEGMTREEWLRGCLKSPHLRSLG